MNQRYQCWPQGGGSPFIVERPRSWTEYDVLADFDGTVRKVVGLHAGESGIIRKRSVSKGARSYLKKRRYTGSVSRGATKFLRAQRGKANARKGKKRKLSLRAKSVRKKLRRPKTKRGVIMVRSIAGVKAAIKRTGAAGKSFGFRTKNGNPAVVRYGKKKKGGKTFKKTVAVVYTRKDGKRVRLIDTRIRKRILVKKRRKRS